MAGNAINTHSFAKIMQNFYPDQKTLISTVNGLTEVKPILADGPVREADYIDMDMVTRWTSLPAPYWHKLGEGLTATLGQQEQATETMGMLRNQMRINEEILMKCPDRDGYMAQQEPAYLEAMEQELENTLIYGSKATAPEEFDGLHVRYGSLVANSVLNNGGSDTGNLTTVWLIQWHPQECCFIFPKGGKGGFRRVPGGRVYLSTEDTTALAAHATALANQAMAWYIITDYEWDMGLCVKDTRRIKAVRNVHKTINHANQIDENVLIQAKDAFRTGGTIYAYCAQAVASQLQIKIKDKGNVWMNPTNPFGEPTTYVLNMPIRVTDAQLLSEATVS
jgi:hypothetical protein